MFCPNCGANLIDGAEFCQKCGAQIKKKEEPAPQQEPVYSQPTAAPAAAVAPNRSKTPIIIAVCAVIVVLIAAIVAVVAISALKGNDSQVSAGYDWEENENDTSSDLPEFCGKYNGNVSYAVSYENKYFGFKVDCPYGMTVKSKWHFVEDGPIKEALGLDTKSTIDLDNLEYGTIFIDMAAVDDNTGNFITVQFGYYGGSTVGMLAGYSSEDEFIDELMSDYYAAYSESNGEYIDYSTYGDTVNLGNLKTVSATVNCNYADGTSGCEKEFFAVKDDVIIVITMGNYVSDDMSEMEAMFSGV